MVTQRNPALPLERLIIIASKFYGRTPAQVRTRTVRIRSLDRTDWLEENDGSHLMPACWQVNQISSAKSGPPAPSKPTVLPDASSYRIISSSSWLGRSDSPANKLARGLFLLVGLLSLGDLIHLPASWRGVFSCWLDFFSRQIFFTRSELKRVGSHIEFRTSISCYSEAEFTPQTA